MGLKDLLNTNIKNELTEEQIGEILNVSWEHDPKDDDIIENEKGLGKSSRLKSLNRTNGVLDDKTVITTLYGVLKITKFIEDENPHFVGHICIGGNKFNEEEFSLTK